MIESFAHPLEKLDREAIQSIARFLRSQLNPNGGFRGRSAASDLYYTVFGLACVRALKLEIPEDRTADFLEPFADGAGLDFVHLTCLARCWGLLKSHALPADRRSAMVTRLTGYQCTDGAFSRIPGKANGFIYETFLAMQAFQGLDAPMPHVVELGHSLQRLQTADQAFANAQHISQGTTTVTAAAAVLLKQFGQPIPEHLADWLLARQHHAGGFLANPEVPLPDLLSTATALHALGLLQQLHQVRRQACLDFVEHLWDANGGFCGHPADPTSDCEYTFYGLLALEHLLA